MSAGDVYRGAGIQQQEQRLLAVFGGKVEFAGLRDRTDDERLAWRTGALVCLASVSEPRTFWGDAWGAACESDGWGGRWGPWVMAGHDETCRPGPSEAWEAPVCRAACAAVAPSRAERRGRERYDGVRALGGFVVPHPLHRGAHRRRVGMRHA